MSKRRFPTDLETARSLNKVLKEELERVRSENATLRHEHERIRYEGDDTINALAGALKAAKIAMHRGEFGDKGRDKHVPAQVDAALRLAGRLK